MSMIYLRLAGGLGNQLFQIAAASLAAKYLQSRFYICEESLASYVVSRPPLYRNLLELSSLPIVDNALADKALVHLCSYYRIGKLPGLRVAKLPPTRHLLRYLGFPLFMDGYYQQSWELRNLMEAVDLLKLAIKPYSLKFSFSNPNVAIHVRGGDFLGLSDFNFVGYDFYRSCVGLAVSQGLLNFVIVSDDPVFSTKITTTLAADFPSASFVHHHGTSPLDDFHVLRTAHARIIGNSTFAWWAFALSSALGPTWSPGAFLRNRPRPYRLSQEIVVDAY